MSNKCLCLNSFVFCVTKYLFFGNYNDFLLTNSKDILLLSTYALYSKLVCCVYPKKVSLTIYLLSVIRKTGSCIRLNCCFVSNKILYA